MISEQDTNHSEVVEGAYVFSARELLRILRRRLWVILLTTIIFVAMAVGFSLYQTPRYEASIKILVGQESGISENPGDAMGLQELTRTMAEAVNSLPIAETVIRRLDLDVTQEEFLEDNLSVEQIPDTQFVEVAYTDTDPENARLVANTVGEVFSEQISEISPSTNTITATVWAQAVTPDDPVSPRPLRDALLALVLGSVVGVGLALLLEYLDDSWQSAEEAERVSGVPNFGVVPDFRFVKNKKGG